MIPCAGCRCRALTPRAKCGYWLVAADGGVFVFSNKRFFGSLGNNPPPAPIIGVAAFSIG